MSEKFPYAERCFPYRFWCLAGAILNRKRCLLAATGKHQDREYLVIVLKEVMVTSYDVRTDDNSDILYEGLALNFAKLEVSYQPQKAGGAKDGGPVKFGWNIRENIKI